MLNFVLFSIPEGGKKARSIYPALKAPILIGSDSLRSNKKQFVNTSFAEQVMSIWSRGHKSSDHSQIPIIECFPVLN